MNTTRTVVCLNYLRANSRWKVRLQLGVSSLCFSATANITSLPYRILLSTRSSFHPCLDTKGALLSDAEKINTVYTVHVQITCSVWLSWLRMEVLIHSWDLESAGSEAGALCPENPSTLCIFHRSLYELLFFLKHLLLHPRFLLLFCSLFHGNVFFSFLS